MNIYTFRDEEQFVQTGANLISSLLHTNPRATLGLATGSTPVGLYAKLIEMNRQGLVSFAQTTTYNLDEYVGLPENHPESYRTFMNEKFFNHVDIQMDRTHVPNGNAADPEAECLNYDKMLEEYGPVDLQLLGLGHNGHIGFNEPGESLSGGTHVVELQEKTRNANARFFPTLDDVPTHAITMGVATIMKARQILLLVRGEDKAEIVHRALTGPITTECPASLLQCHPNVVVLLDQGAGRLLV
ncbi:glucosamine-6-phosphate deaminase [Paenibacillus sp. cl141a]|uniref:glucosamine-6-phosphate deaminase n=1 Tax=Bacillales TaxID=1385 RepID=UPI00017894BA|nr:MULTISPECIES: glucosamine-6-phosphate deaminase [Paenibacillus]ACX63756.1 glucosamine-6-phosphate isomerase [Paenibacillus sp. Y412MC10]EGG36446.1 glucosamine-6-phosphate deaminase [Paenibacillus sp. HGF5]ETT64810.1 glucosamine-6-phosphate isomerase [Paenibacillus sp. FSL H8-457]MCM3260241.1 glucosamine-6-phosphate deaminase [Paenibacillus lautus]WFB60138.1 glucosamine-6-phosphate deaminase [Paenibacillus sp. BR1-192]